MRWLDCGAMVGQEDDAGDGRLISYTALFCVLAVPALPHPAPLWPWPLGTLTVSQPSVVSRMGGGQGGL